MLEELDEREDGDSTREAWWAEIRQEVRSHARALACNIILGYEACALFSLEFSYV